MRLQPDVGPALPLTLRQVGHCGGHHADACGDLGRVEPEADEAVVAQRYVRTYLSHGSQDLGGHVLIRDNETGRAALNDYLKRRIG